MKKLTHLIVGTMIVLAPLSASALEALSADSMKAATGQAGVSIGIDDVILYQNTGDTTYVDNDGTDGTAGGVEITGAESLLAINAIIGDGSDADTADDLVGSVAAHLTNYDTMLTTAGYTLTPSALTIDVGTCDVLTAISASTTDTIGGVAIGLPTLEIYDALANNEKIISLVQAGAANDGDEFIEIQTTGNTMAILGGTLEIAPH
ncbi:MAG: DUF6160 family protein [Desulfosalsimonadaceae bacterium]